MECMCLVVEIHQFSYMLLTKRKQKPAILQAWTTKQNGLNKMRPNVFAKCEITHNVLLWIHRVSTIVASVSKTWMLFQIQSFFMSRSRHDHFPRLSRSEIEMRHWHGETETLKNVSRDRDTSRDIQLCSQLLITRIRVGFSYSLSRLKPRASKKNGGLGENEGPCHKHWRPFFWSSPISS